MNNNENKSSDLDLADLLYRYLLGLKKTWQFIIIIICVLALSGAGYAFISYTPYYNSSVTFTVTSEASVSDMYYSNATAEQMVKTFPYIFTSGPLEEIVAADLGVDEIDANINASFLDETNMFTITVSDKEPQRAYDILVSIMNNYPQVSRYVIAGTQLNIIIEPKIAIQPANSIPYKRYAVYGILIGALIGLLLLTVMALTYSGVRTPEDIEKICSAKVLGIVPKEKNKNGTASIMNRNTSEGFKESINSMRISVLRECNNNKVKKIVLSSTVQNEGKTTIAANLALSLARKSDRVILVDCDMRRPAIKQQLSIRSETNTILDVLQRKKSLSSSIYNIANTKLDVIFGGADSSRASELISSQRMNTLIKKLEEKYDIIIFDTPPCGVVSDAISLANRADALIYVVSQNMAPMSKIESCIDSFSSCDVKMLGCVLNNSKSLFSPYSAYGYGAYGYGGSYGYSSNRGNYLGDISESVDN